MSEMKQSSIRLPDEQITALKTEAKRISKAHRIDCKWTSLVRIAVDELIASRKRHKAASAKAA
jgi:hypothetical protein